MRISLEGLHILDVVERSKSFAAAAQELNRVPSAITYAINQLESDLGVVLFDRSGYRAQLTAVGQEFLKEGRAILEQAQALEKRIKISAGLAPPNLSISYDDALGFDGIKRILELFFEFFPEISVDLYAEILNGSRDALLSGARDLVIGWFAELPIEPHYRYKVLGQMPFVFAVAPHHPLAQVHSPLTFKEITSHRIVIVPDSAKSLSKAASGYAPDRQFLSVSSMESKVRAQVAGLGIGFLPLILAKPYLQEGLLIEKEVDRPKSDSRCYLAWREDKLTPASRYLIDIIQKNKKWFSGI